MWFCLPPSPLEPETGDRNLLPSTCAQFPQAPEPPTLCSLPHMILRQHPLNAGQLFHLAFNWRTSSVSLCWKRNSLRWAHLETVGHFPSFVLTVYNVFLSTRTLEPNLSITCESKELMIDTSDIYACSLMGTVLGTTVGCTSKKVDRIKTWPYPFLYPCIQQWNLSIHSLECIFPLSFLSTRYFLLHHTSYCNKSSNWALGLPDSWFSYCEGHHKSIVYPHFQPSPALFPQLGFQNPPWRLPEQHYFLLFLIVSHILCIWALVSVWTTTYVVSLV